jgi:fumarate reductase flavoprotein subunit
MMGGVVFDADCTTALTGLFAAGEDTGGVHGANRLGGNGVANSTVFGGIAGETMATWVTANREWRTPDIAAAERAIAASEAPFRVAPGNPEAVREALLDCMWDDVGILREDGRLRRAIGRLSELDAELDRTGVDGTCRDYNMSWHDWLNLKSLIAVSRVIATAALARENSRGAHFREDFPDAGDLGTSSFTVARQHGAAIEIAHERVQFTRVNPGESLVGRQAEPVVSRA